MHIAVNIALLANLKITGSIYTCIKITLLCFTGSIQHKMTWIATLFKLVLSDAYASSRYWAVAT